MTSPEKVIDCGQGVRLIRGRTMRTRDGVLLVSDHYLPAESDPAPTLLMRQPYGRDIASTVVYAHPVWFAHQGYNVVIQDVRGRGDSEGDFYPFRHEAEDGYDTIQWAASLPESNGKVGMYGFSYQGLTQLLAATQQPPALCAMAPAMTVGDLYQGWFYLGGLFRLASGIGWANQMLRGDAVRAKLIPQSEKLERHWANLSASYTQTPYGQLSHLVDEKLPSYYRDWTQNDAPSPYWSSHDISTRYDKITVPALHLAGWYDLYLQGSLDCFTALRVQAGTPHARNHQYLVVGPWQHIPWDRYIGEQDLGETAVMDTDRLLLRWFNHWLKDDQGFTAEPRVQIFTLVKNRWNSLSDWPPAAAQSKNVTFYLSSEGKANSRKGDGLLDFNPPPQGQKRDILVVDPEVPVGAAGGGGAAPGPYRQDRLEGGNNVLVYCSQPLVEALTICGNPSVEICLTASSSECDLVAKLVRIDPEGKAWNVCLGAARAKLHFKDAPLVADQPGIWTFPLEATACVIDRGECLGLELSGTSFPLLDRSSNRAEIPAREAGPLNWRRVTLQVIHDQVNVSKLVLPILK